MNDSNVTYKLKEGEQWDKTAINHPPHFCPNCESMTVLLEFNSAREALDWCFRQCPKRLGDDLGCAFTCELRRRYGLRPFGRSCLS